MSITAKLRDIICGTGGKIGGLEIVDEESGALGLWSIVPFGRPFGRCLCRDGVAAELESEGSGGICSHLACVGCMICG